MALWLVRGGKYGEYESDFIDQNVVCLTWAEVTADDLSNMTSRDEVREHIERVRPDESAPTINNWASQLWAFIGRLQPGDLVVMPRKNKATIAIGEITGPCIYDHTQSESYRHRRSVVWLKTDVPRSNFDQDILYSFGAFLTICKITRNDAETRVKAMAANNWQVPATTATAVPSGPLNNTGEDADSPDALVDLEQLAKDDITKLLIQKFKGHGMARLVDAILRAQGFTTFLSPEGADKGIDILAARGSFGFGDPKICVQVKSGDTPTDHPEFMHLVGAMQSVQADRGLFVSWSDFKQSVYREEAAKFFKVRLWNQRDLVNQLLENYDQLDQDIRAEIPLKRIWLVANPTD